MYYKHLSKQEIDLIILNVQSGVSSAKEEALKHNMSCISLISKIRNYYPNFSFIKTRRLHFLNHNYFDEIGPSQAYILGLIASDGYVQSKEHGYSKNFWSIKLQERDKAILEKINTKIERKSGLIFEKNPHPNRQNLFILRVSSERMVKKLLSLDITPKKSLTYKIHSSLFENHDLFFHFLRGMMDGDGSVQSQIRYNKNNSKNKNYSFAIFGNKFSCQQISTFLFENYDLGSGNIHKRKDSNCCSVNIGGNLQMKKLYTLLYKDAELFLQRKYDIFQELITQDL